MPRCIFAPQKTAGVTSYDASNLGRVARSHSLVGRQSVKHGTPNLECEAR